MSIPETITVLEIWIGHLHLDDIREETMIFKKHSIYGQAVNLLIQVH